MMLTLVPALRAYALTLKVELRASPHSETESSVKESLRKFRFVADSQLEICEPLVTICG